MTARFRCKISSLFPVSGGRYEKADHGPQRGSFAHPTRLGRGWSGGAHREHHRGGGGEQPRLQHPARGGAGGGADADPRRAGPYTVFAPTNAAFAKVPADQLQALLNNPAQLRAVLLYHVVPGRVTSAQVAGLTSATTAQGGTLTVSASGGTVQINDATVTQADLAASNGIIHVIDTVLLPPS